MQKFKSKLLFQIKSGILLKHLWLKLIKTKTTPVTSEKAQNNYARKDLNYLYDCSKPKTFNEYLGWLKFNYRNPVWEICADKIKCKEYLKSIGLEKYVVKTLSVYNSIEEIDLSLLPQKFVLKTNHDCGSIFICDKEKTDFKEVFKKLQENLNSNYSNKNGEWVYSNIKPIIFAEEYLEANEEDLKDYKLFIIDGIYKWGYVAQERQSDLKISVFEDDFVLQNVEYDCIRPSKKNKPSKPECFEEMIKIAETIGNKLGFARVDFYNTSKGLKVGEITFFSFSGKGCFTKYSYDLKYGNYLKESKFIKEIKANL